MVLALPVVVEVGGVDLAPWILAHVVYIFIRLLANKLAPGDINGWRKQEYYVSIFHQSVVLPACFVIYWAGSYDFLDVAFIGTVGYFMSDIILNYDLPVFEWSFAAHHVVASILIILARQLPEILAMLGGASLVVLELGGLMISVADVVPSPLAFRLRCYTYIVSRVITFAIFSYMLWAANFVQTVTLGINMAALSIHNTIVAKAMYLGLKKDIADCVQTTQKKGK
jgi:hypothetical protein